MAKSVDMKRWYVIVTARAKREAQDFVTALQRAGKGMQFNIGQPRV